MRIINGFKYLDDVNILLKYLYMSEDNSISYKNAINVEFKLNMDEDFSLIKTMVTGAMPGQKFNGDELSISDLIAIVEQLKDSLAIEFPDQFTNRFDEIKNMTLQSTTLNNTKKRNND